MLQIDYYAYANRLVSVHPAEKAAFAAITMAICIASPSPLVYLAVTVLMAGVVVLGAGIPGTAYLKLLSVPALFLAVSAAVVAVSVSLSPVDYLVSIGAGSYLIGVHPRDLYTAFSLFFKSLGATSCLFFLSLTTPMVDLTNTLRKMRVPALIIDLMVIMYRFIFVLIETAEIIYTSQSSRLGYINVKTGWRSMGTLLASLFIRTCRRSEDLFTALSARGYTGDMKVLETRYAFSVLIIMAIIAIDALLALLNLAKGMGGGLFA